MGGIDAEIADALIERSVRLLRLQAGYQRDVLRLLRDMERELIARLTDSRELTEFSRQRLLDLLAQTRSRIASTYSEAARAVNGVAVATVEAEYVRRTLRAKLGTALVAALPSDTVLRRIAADPLIQGGPASLWWERQGQDTAFRLANAIRQGIAQGETNAQIVGRVRGTRTQPGILEVSRRNAEALARTSVQEVVSDARLETYRANDDVIEGLEQASTLDGRTTDICVAYSGAQWDLDGKPINGTTLPFNGGPPRHWNCRSVLVPIVKPLPGMPGFRAGQRASRDGPVAGDMTMERFLEGKSKAFQDDLLGEGRAQLWRDGKITLQQLLDQSGRPLTLEQLRQRYG